MQIESNLPRVIDVEARLDQIAARYKSAGGLGINVLNVIGGKRRRVDRQAAVGGAAKSGKRDGQGVASGDEGCDVFA